MTATVSNHRPLARGLSNRFGNGSRALYATDASNYRQLPSKVNLAQLLQLALPG